MGVCETCGNNYKNTFQVTMNGKVHNFDCFECAIQNLAPVCGNCSCRIIGQGVEENGVVFCGHHCERMAAPAFLSPSADNPPV
ncbi:hypothetical protein D3C87_162610 [compost metagenome]